MRRRMVTGRIGKAVRRRTGDHRFVTFSNRISERDQIVLIGRGRQWARVPNQLPPAGRGDTTGMRDAEVP